MADGVNVPGKGKAVVGLVLGIVSLVLSLTSAIPVAGLVTSILAIALGIVGLVMSSQSKKEGFTGGLRTAAFVISLLGLIFAGIGFIACQGCTACLACEGAGLASMF